MPREVRAMSGKTRGTKIGEIKNGKTMENKNRNK